MNNKLLSAKATTSQQSQEENSQRATFSGAIDMTLYGCAKKSPVNANRSTVVFENAVSAESAVQSRSNILSLANDGSKAKELFIFIRAFNQSINSSQLNIETIAQYTAYIINTFTPAKITEFCSRVHELHFLMELYYQKQFDYNFRMLPQPFMSELHQNNSNFIQQDQIELIHLTIQSKIIEHQCYVINLAKLRRIHVEYRLFTTEVDKIIEIIARNRKNYYVQSLMSERNQYFKLNHLGEGTFGKVAKAWKMNSNEIVAIKTYRKGADFEIYAQREVRILSLLNKEDSEKYNFVRALEYFQEDSCTNIVFEILGLNVEQYQKSNNFAPMPLHGIRLIVKQILMALHKLKELNVIHADLKPENIAFVNHLRQPYRVKLIDFGSALARHEANSNMLVQSIYYRAPEVILGLDFNESIDMWSLGCVMAELFLGYALYPGQCEYDILRYVIDTQNIPPHNILSNALRASDFFRSVTFYNENSSFTLWELKPANMYNADAILMSRETRKYRFRSLDEIAAVNLSNNYFEQRRQLIERGKFIDMIKKALNLDLNARLTPEKGLNHEFITEHSG